jgi:carbonic anhydrase
LQSAPRQWGAFSKKSAMVDKAQSPIDIPDSEAAQQFKALTR